MSGGVSTYPPFPVGGEYYPWLVYNNGGGDQTLCGISEQDEFCSESKNIPELSDKKVMYCSIDGHWLLLLHATNNKDEEVKLSIWNPKTLESIALPRVRVTEDVVFEYIDKAQALFTSSSPNDPNCMVFLFLGGVPVLLYCRVGDQNWREFNYAQAIEAQRPSMVHMHECCVFEYHQLNHHDLHDLHTCTQLLHQPVCFNGKIYALSSCSMDVVQINVDDQFKVCSLTVLLSKFQGPVPSFGRIGTARRSFLVSWPDEGIFLIDIFSTNSPDLKSLQAPQIMVLWFDFSTNSWLRMTSLNQGAIFLGSSYSLVCPWGSRYPNKWSGIYYTSDYNQRILLSYRVEDGTITSYSTCPTANLPEEPPQWIMPAEDVEEPLRCIRPVEDVKQQPQRSLLSLIAKYLSSFVEYPHRIMPVEDIKQRRWSLGSFFAKNLYFFSDYIRFLGTQNTATKQGKGKQKRLYDNSLTMDCSKKQRVLVEEHGSAGMMVEEQGKGKQKRVYDNYPIMDCSKRRMLAEEHGSAGMMVEEQGKGKGKRKRKRKRVYDNNPIMVCSKKQRMLVEEQGSAGMMVEEQGQSSFSDLPSDLLGLIAENHLYSFPAYVRFPFINKSCATSRIGITRKNPFHPCLIYGDEAKGVYNITDSFLSHKLSVKIPQVLKGKMICCSRDGWILLAGYGSSPECDYDCLFNPFTEQIVETAGSRYGRVKYGISNLTFLGKPSSSSPQNCSVLAMSLLSSRRASQLQQGNPATEGKAEWWTLVVGVLNQPVEFIPSCICPVLLRDCWYFLGHNGRLGRLQFTDMKERRFVWKVETHECPCQNYTRSYLLDCGGELVSVFIADSDQESWIRVFKLGDKIWEEVDSVRTYTLYLGWPSSMGCHAQTPDMADRIYFPRFHKGCLVYYSLKTKKYYSIGSSGRDHELKSFHGTTMYSNSAWIIPEIVG